MTSIIERNLLSPPAGSMKYNWAQDNYTYSERKKHLLKSDLIAPLLNYTLWYIISGSEFIHNHKAFYFGIIANFILFVYFF